MNERTCLDIFTGLAGFSLAAEVHGVRTVAMCEADEERRAFLERAWPGIPVHPDIRTFDGKAYRGVWAVLGGPPCQPASRAGDQRGADDNRWLWQEALRVVEEARPAWVLFENPVGVIDVGLDGILSDMEGRGYEVEPVSIPACAVNSPQDRERIWLIGHVGDAAGVRPQGRDAKLPQRTIGRAAKPAYAGAWNDYIWLGCPDGKGKTIMRRCPSGLCEMADGVSKGLLAALGNGIVWPVAAEIIGAMIEAEQRQ